MILGASYYLPHERLIGSNFPEIITYRADIESILDYTSIVDSALYDYNEGITDKIDINISELREHIELCRTVASKLGLADNVCFELLSELRTIQENMQLVEYLGRTYGTTYVGTPTEDDEESGAV